MRFKQDVELDAALLVGFNRGRAHGYMAAAMSLGLTANEATLRGVWVSDPKQASYRMKVGQRAAELLT